MPVNATDLSRSARGNEIKSPVFLLMLIGSLAVPRPGVAQSDLAADYADAVGKLRIIGSALREYADDHPTDEWPGLLTNLVAEGYLDAGNLICRADYSHGTEGGKPDDGDSATVGPQFEEVDEDGCSFFYDFTEAPCSWYGGIASWGDASQHQLQHGDAFHPGAYDARLFPSVRCFWLGFGNSSVLGSQTVINLAADRTTVFASHVIWELQADVSPDATPELRDVFQNLPESPPPPSPQATLGALLLFPLWPKAVDASNLTYRLVEPTGTGQAQILGTLDGNILQWTPDHYSPSNCYIRVELLRDGTAVTNKTYMIHVPGTDGDGMPNDWESDQFRTLARDGTLDYDSDGFIDLHEYVAGTCPTNGNDYLRISSVWMVANPIRTALRWSSVTGRTYHVLCATNLLADWRTNGSPLEGSGSDLTVTNLPAPDAAFYRLSVNITDE